MKYVPISYANINLKKVVDEKIEEVRLVKNSNKIYFGGVVQNHEARVIVLIGRGRVGKECTWRGIPPFG